MFANNSNSFVLCERRLLSSSGLTKQSPSTQRGEGGGRRWDHDSASVKLRMLDFGNSGSKAASSVPTSIIWVQPARTETFVSGDGVSCRQGAAVFLDVLPPSTSYWCVFKCPASVSCSSEHLFCISEAFLYQPRPQMSRPTTLGLDLRRRPRSNSPDQLFYLRIWILFNLAKALLAASPFFSATSGDGSAKNNGP